VNLRKQLPEAKIDSAGTGDWHLGKPPHGPAIAAAAAGGHDLTPLRARQVSVEDLARFDLILAMDRQNLRDLRALAAGGPAEVRLFLEPVGGGDVPDPYFTGDFDGALDLIEAAARAWAERLA
jgi:protein-tyrosine phosphatase